MPVSFWIRRFLVVFAGAFILLFAVYAVKGRKLPRAAGDAAVWAGAAATLFIATRLYHSSKGRQCELCRDMPEDDPSRTPPSG